LENSERYSGALASFANGYNPLRWDCEKQGCFNKKKRPKIEVFAECLPGKIAFSDVDAIVEVNSNFLLQEWKEYPDIPTGQKIMYERLTAGGKFAVFLVHGSAETMEIHSMGVFWNGNFKGWKASSLSKLKARVRDWAQWAINGKHT
jgi:hypothetical protein